MVYFSLVTAAGTAAWRPAAVVVLLIGHPPVRRPRTAPTRGAYRTTPAGAALPGLRLVDDRRDTRLEDVLRLLDGLPGVVDLVGGERFVGFGSILQFGDGLGDRVLSEEQLRREEPAADVRPRERLVVVVLDVAVVGALVGVIAGPGRRVDVPLNRRLGRPSLLGRQKRLASVFTSHLVAVLVHIVSNYVTEWLPNRWPAFGHPFVPMWRAGLGSVLELDERTVGSVRVEVVEVESANSTDATAEVPDEVEQDVPVTRVLVLGELPENLLDSFLG